MERGADTASQQQHPRHRASPALAGNASFVPGTCCHPDPRLCFVHSRPSFAHAAGRGALRPAGSPSGHAPQRAGPSRHQRPAMSFVALITMAIVESPEKKLTLNKIYEFIANKYPYFQDKHKRWHNSVRHSLSFNDCFVRLPRAPGSRGSFWTMHPRSSTMFVNGCYLRRVHCFRDEQRRRPTLQLRQPASQSQSNDTRINLTNNRETFCSRRGPDASTMAASNPALHSGQTVAQSGFPESFDLFLDNPMMLPGPSGAAALRVENVDVLPSQGTSSNEQMRPSIQIPGPSDVEVVRAGDDEVQPNRRPSVPMSPSKQM